MSCRLLTGSSSFMSESWLLLKVKIDSWNSGDFMESCPESFVTQWGLLKLLFLTSVPRHVVVQQMVCRCAMGFGGRSRISKTIGGGVSPASGNLCALPFVTKLMVCFVAASQYAMKKMENPYSKGIGYVCAASGQRKAEFIKRTLLVNTNSSPYS